MGYCEGKIVTERLDVPSLEISQTLLEELQKLARQDIRFRAPEHQGCGHWELTSGESLLACACQTDTLPALLGLLADLVATVEVPEDDAEEAKASRSAVPTPAQIMTKPLTYTPPKFLRKERIRFLAEAQEQMGERGLDEEQVQDILDAPDEILPGEKWRTIYRRDGIDVVYSEQDYLVLAVEPSSQQAVGGGQPRLPGQKAELRLPVPSSVDEMVALLRSRGFVVEHGGKHWKVSKPGHSAPYPLPYTPSDFRWALNTIADIRAIFGVDLRERAED